jgi:hypothetical protein
LAIEKLANFGRGFSARFAIYGGHRFDPSCLWELTRTALGIASDVRI